MTRLKKIQFFNTETQRHKIWHLIFVVQILIFAALPAIPALAQGGVSATELLLQANKQYETGNFAAAIDTYEQLVDLGVRDSTVFYNLGNAYFKNGDLGRAILNYRRAAQLSPRDADIRANLTLARSKTIDNIQSSGSAISQLAAFSQRWFTLNELAWVSLGLWVLLATLIIAHSRIYRPVWRKFVQYTLAVVAALFVAGAVMLASRIIVSQNQPAAIIVAEAVDVTSGPGEQYVTEYTLHGGTEIVLGETRGKWVRIALPGNQLQGWIPASTVEAIAN